MESEKGDATPTSPPLASRAQQRRSNIFHSDPDAHNVSPSLIEAGQTTKWVPSSLKTTTMLVNIFLLLGLAIAMEVVRKVNHDNYGWGKPAGYWSEHPSLHIAWTTIPGLFTFLVVSQWTGVDQDVKVLQPYIDMSQGNGDTAEKTVLLNYQRQNPWIVQISMIRNRHYAALIANGLCLLTIAVGPLASAFFYLQTPSEKFTQPLSNVSVVEQLGLQDPYPFANLHSAAGFSLASSIFTITPPPFIRFLDGAAWTASRLSIGGVRAEGTVKAHTVCLRSTANCIKATASYSTFTNTISGSTPSGNCTFQARITDSPGWVDPAPYGISPASCYGLPTSSRETSPVVFWMVNGTNAFSTICTPTITLQRADVLLNATTNTLITVDNQTPLLNEDAGGIDRYSAPYNGSAFNAVLYSSTPDIHSLAHLNATLFALGHTIARGFQKADPSSSNADQYTNVAADTYGHYLGLAAQNMYFAPSPGKNVQGVLHATTPRLFVSTIVAHVLTAIFIILALGGLAIMILHRRARRDLTLASEPGTLAAAVSVAGNSELPRLIDGKDSELAMRAMLSDLRFGIDKDTGRVRVAEGPEGYTEVPHFNPPPGPSSPLSPSALKASLFGSPTKSSTFAQQQSSGPQSTSLNRPTSPDGANQVASPVTSSFKPPSESHPSTPGSICPATPPKDKDEANKEA